MRTKKFFLGLGILALAGLILNVFANSIEDIQLVPNLDISRFAPYKLHVTTSGEILSGEFTMTTINGDGGNCTDYYASGDCASPGGITSFTGAFTYSGDIDKRISNNIYPDNIYPEIFFADGETTLNNSPSNAEMSRTNYNLMYFINPFSMQSDMSFFIELNVIPRQVANSENLLVYLVEKDKDINFFGSERRTDTGVQLVGSFSRTATAHHTHTSNSSHYLIPLSTNGDGTIGTKNIDVSGNFWIVLVADTTLPSKGRYLRYQEDTLCQNTSGRYEGNLNTRSTTRKSGCPDAHIHIARRGINADSLQAEISMYATGDVIITGDWNGSFTLPNLPPNATSFITPTSGSYTGDIYISRYPASDPNGNSVSYNIYLTDTGGNTLETLTGNISATEFTRDSTSTGDGTYNLMGEACDGSLCSTFNLSEDFIVDNVPDPEPTSYQSGLILYLPFDEDTDDYSPYANHGSGFNINAISGKVGGAYTFNGINSYVSIPNDFHLNPTTGITLSAWVRWNINPTSGSGWAAIINKNADNQYRLQHNSQNTGFEFALRNPTNRTTISSTQPISGTWYHVVGTYDTQTLNIYVNGVLEQTLTTSGIINTGTIGINIGRRTSADRHFNGDIDEVAIWGRALSSGEVSGLYNNGNGLSLTSSPATTTYTLNYSAGTGGSLSGDTNQTVDENDDGTAVEAIADSGYSFSQRSDGITDNPRTDLNVTGNISVTAEFTGGDSISPTASIEYTPASGARTNTDVLAIITGFSEPVTGLNATGYLFTGNGSFLFTFEDLSGNTGEALATVDRIDKEIPIVTLNGSATINVEYGDDYTELGATRSDNVDGTGDVSIISGTVNTGVLGTYLLEYIYVDQAGNTGTNTRTVIVEDTTPPVITLSGAATIDVEFGNDYIEFGATRTDNIDGTGIISSPTSGTVDTGTIGTYILEYTYIDNQGNTGNTVTRTVIVQDTTPPVVTINGSGTVYIEIGDNFVDEGATWIDPPTTNSGTIPAYTSGTINTGAIGTYTIEYQYFDGYNTGSDTRTVIVEDTTKPTATIEYTPASGAWTNSDVLAIITGFSESVTGLNATGYLFTDNGTFLFTFEDLAENTGEALATVDRIDKEAPIITLNGSATINVEFGDDYTELGATRSDNVDGTGDVSIISGTVNTGTLGTYLLEYIYVDQAGNTGTNTRTVIVEDTTPPTATIEYTPASGARTNADVLAIITGFSEPVTGLNATGYLFTGNGTFLFTFEDLAENTGEALATVDRIDKQAPIINSTGTISTTTGTATINGIDITEADAGLLSAFMEYSGVNNSTITGNLQLTTGNLSNLTGFIGGLDHNATYTYTITFTDNVGNISFITGTFETIIDRNIVYTEVRSGNILSGINTNLSSVTNDNVTNYSGLYLEIPSIGKIEILTGIDLTDPGTQEFLQSLDDTMIMENGYINFIVYDSSTASGSAFKNSPATLTMYMDPALLPNGIGLDTNLINVRDTNGNIIPSNSIISNVDCTGASPQICTFTTNHFTEFGVKPTLPFVTIYSDNTNPGFAKSGDTITLSFTGSEPLTGVIATIASNGATIIGTGTERSGSYTLAGGESEGISIFDIDFEDFYSNTGITVTATTDSSQVIIDFTNPSVTNITSGEYFSGDITPTIIETNYSGATLNGSEYTSGTAITGDGNYELIVYDLAGNNFAVSFVIDTTPPTFAGVASGAYYSSNVAITFDDLNLSGATLNDNPYTSGTTISSEGIYTFIVTDLAGNSTGATFVIDKTDPIFTGGNSGAYYSGNVEILFLDLNLSGATVNGNPYNSGDPISTEGTNIFIVYDLAGNFTGSTFIIDTTPPTFTGVVSGAYYSGNVAITFDDLNLSGATLNDNPYISGTTISSEGIYTFVATDLAGNSTGATFVIDTTQPTFAGVVSGAYYSGNVTITFDDLNLSGATLNGTTYTSGTTISSEGIYTFIVTDLAGNSTGASFIIDTTYPIVNTGILFQGNTGTNGTDIYYKGTIDIMAEVSDTGGSELNTTSCEYTIDGSTRNAASYDTGYCYTTGIIPANDIYIQFRMQDNAGNLTTGNTGIYLYDNTAPNTTDNANSTTGNVDVTVTLTAVDTGVGLAETYYCVDTTNTCIPTIAGTSVAVTGAIGVVTHKFVRYYSTDILGTIEIIKTSAQINIDKENPYLTGTTTFISNNTTNSGYAKIGNTITINFTSHEALTGTPILTIIGGSNSTGTVNNIGGNTYSATYIMKDTDNEGTISFDIDMTDLVGNTSTETVHSTIIFDRTPPAGIVITAPTTGTYLKGDPDVYTITRTTGTDQNFGPHSIFIEYSITAPFTFVSSINITTGTTNNGTYAFTFPNTLNTFAKIRIIATDLAGNVSYFTGNQFSIDNTPPTDITITYPGLYLKGNSGYTINRSGGIDANPETIILAYTTNGTTFTTICTRTNNEQSCIRNTPSLNNSSGQLRTVATDKVGMTKQRTTPTFIIDSTPPTAIVFSDNNSNRRNTNATATGTSTDALAGLRSTGMVYRTDTAFTGTCNGGTTTPPTFTGEGYRTGYACVSDNAGNIRTGQQSYKIDKTPPTLQLGSGILTNTATVINITGTDALAGISGYLRSKLSGTGTISFVNTTSEDPSVSADTDGEYVLQVLVKDNANNITTGTISFTRDTTAPILSGATGVNNTTSQTPNYSFTGNEGGTISYSGGCTSTTTTAISGNNTITFSALSNGTYSTCQLRVTDAAGNNSARLDIPSFTVSYSPPSGGGGGGGGGGGFFIPTCTIQDLVCGIDGKYTTKAGVTCQGGELGNSCGTDICVDGDYSGDPNDGICHDPTKVEAKTGTTSTGKRVPFVSPYNKELTDAYSYAYGVKITTVPKIERANLNGILIRSHLAKMMSEYTMKVLGKTPDTSRNCVFKDMNNQTEEFKKYAKMACQLGLMGLKTDGTPADVFNPDNEVTRAIFGTTLSRAIRGEKNNGGKTYYEKHLAELKNVSIMTQIDKPLNREIRGYVMLMMMRSDQKLFKSKYSDFTSLRGSSTFVSSTTNTTSTTTTPQFTAAELDFIKNINKDYQFTEGYTVGQSNPGVRYLQYFLKTKKYYDGTINGVNNTATVSALFKFQFDNGIVNKESDQGAGYLGPTTRDTINPLLQKLLNP